jgi:hypothetical protein
MDLIVSSEAESANIVPVTQENHSVLCPVCFDDVSITSEEYIISCHDTSHPGFHRECLCHYIQSKVSEGFPGACPSINCPCEHVDKKRKILRFPTWNKIVPTELSQKFRANAESLLAFLCSNCHVLRTISVPYVEEEVIKSKETLRDKMGNIPKYEAFLIDLDQYSLGEMNVLELYDKISSLYFQEFQTGEDKDVWVIFKLILQIIEDPERRANLHLRHLKIRPRMWTPCCTKEHCFRCRTKDFHTGKTCEQNTKALDSTIVPCPSCGLYLTKGDGCNSVTCVCGKKFSWNEEKETNERTAAFLASFPENTSYRCAEVLCETITGNETNALAWRLRHAVMVNQAILRHWLSLYPHCPHQAVALLDASRLSQGRQIAVEVWESKYNAEVKKCRNAIEKSKEALFLSLYPTQLDRFYGAKRLLAAQAFSSRDELENQIRLGAKAWASRNSIYYDSKMSSWRRDSAFQFLRIFGNLPVTSTIPGRFNLPHADHWNLEISNSSLSFTNNGRTVKRPGSVSSYPAAFANVPASRSSICVEIDAAFSGPNWLTFGLARRGMENSGSDGVGLTSETWGICDERDSPSEAVIASCGSRIGRCRKFRRGDIVRGVVDLAAGWFEVTIGTNCFTHRFEIPIGSCDDYYFAMTFANNHQATIIPDCNQINPLEASVATAAATATASAAAVEEEVKVKAPAPPIHHLNTDQSEMYFNMKHMISEICKSNDYAAYDYEFLITHSSKWEERIYRAMNLSSTASASTSAAASNIFDDNDRNSAMNNAYDRMKIYIDHITKDGRSADSSPSSPSAQDLAQYGAPSWEDLLGAACWSRLHQERLERERQTILSEEFIIEHQDSASFMAAVLLSPSMIESASREAVARAKAYMKLNPEEMQSWYEYNAIMIHDVGESLIPGLEAVPKECRCLPRHVKICPQAGK